MRQVGHLGEDYEEWVHQPIIGKESPRFFHSSFFEVPKTLATLHFSYHSFILMYQN